MLMRVALFVVLCLGLAGFGAVTWIETRPVAPARQEAEVVAPPVPPVMTPVLVAAHAIHAGGLLKPDDLTSADLPAPEAAAFLRNTPENRTALFGAMVRHTLAQGDPVSDGAIVRQGDHGFLSAVLDPGMRAVTIGLDQIGSDASLIWPGDHIDLILVRETTAPGRSSAHSVSSETVLTDIRVIAVDQQLMQGAAPEEHAQANSKTMTLEVSTEDAKRLAIALKLGKLSVSVRSASAPLALAPLALARTAAPVTWASDVSQSLAGERNAPESATLTIFRGAQTAVARF